MFCCKSVAWQAITDECQFGCSFEQKWCDIIQKWSQIDRIQLKWDLDGSKMHQDVLRWLQEIPKLFKRNPICPSSTQKWPWESCKGVQRRLQMATECPKIARKSAGMRPKRKQILLVGTMRDPGVDLGVTRSIWEAKRTVRDHHLELLDESLRRSRPMFFDGFWLVKTLSEKRFF